MTEKEIREKLDDNWEAMKDENMSSERFVFLSKENIELMKELQKIRS